MTDAPRFLPPREGTRLCFAHHAYDMKPIFDALHPGFDTIQVSNREDLRRVLPGVDVLVASGLWHNDLLDAAPRLKYLQSVSSGTNQYDLGAFRAKGILLASGAGVNMNAVSEHAIALMLAVSRRLAQARDNQHAKFWRPEQTDPLLREDEVAGKTMVILGTGRIGDRIARLARAFDMKVIGIRRDPSKGAGSADEVHGFADLGALAGRADVLVLSCPLTDDTRGLIGADLIAALKPGAILVNVARGPVVDEAALIAALEAGKIAGAGLDVTTVEPLPADSPLWSLPNVVLTPHAAGETRRYEANVLDILGRNLDRLWSGDDALVNRIV
ncbi:D-2-hydroxyacid dehydrogenase [Pseudogemmobacter sonorensis]|uniref:D-2-hydroxyacid dehydrogenase n=1 Tax=Pseudogemmobacter sonorensis TaxID=2989681 RepID=UPI0036779B06